MSTTTRRRTALGAVALLAASSALAACSSGSAGASGDDRESLDITVISGPLADPFFAAMKAGTEEAAKDLGVKVTWTAAKDFSNPAGDYARLGDAAVQGKPDGVVLTYFLPDAQKPSLEKMVDADIPVVFLNQGLDAVESEGAIGYVGEDSFAVGEAVGGRMVDAGAKHAMCFNHTAGIPAAELRCAGLKKALEADGGKVTTVSVPVQQSQDPTAITSAMSGALRTDDSYDAIFTLGSTQAQLATEVVEDAGADVLVGTTDLSKSVLELIKSGAIAFASDQQPFLSGYQSVLSVVQDKRFGLHPIGAVNTAPLWITQDNVDEVIEQNAKNSGIRGAA